MKLRRVRTIVPLLTCVVAIGALLIVGLSRNVVYFRTVSEAVDTRPADGAERPTRFRRAQLLQPGTQATHPRCPKRSRHRVSNS